MIRLALCAFAILFAVGCSGTLSATFDKDGRVTGVMYEGRPLELAQPAPIAEPAPAPVAEPAPETKPEPSFPEPKRESQRALRRLWQLDQAGDFTRARDVGQWLVGEYGRLSREPRRTFAKDDDPDANEPWAPTARRANAAFDRDLPGGR